MLILIAIIYIYPFLIQVTTSFKTAQEAVLILSFNGSSNELSHFIVSAQDPELRTLAKGVAQLASGGLGQGSQYPWKLSAAAIMTIPSRSCSSSSRSGS